MAQFDCQRSDIGIPKRAGTGHDPWIPRSDGDAAAAAPRGTWRETHASDPSSVRLGSLARPGPAGVGAGQVESAYESDTRVNLFCEDVTAGNAHLFLFAETSDTFGSFADLAIWNGSLSGDPDLVGDSSSIVLTPTSGSGSVALVELNGDPARGTRP